MHYKQLQPFEKKLKERTSSKSFAVPFMILAKESYDSKKAISLLLGSLLPKTEDRAHAFLVFDAGQFNETAFWTAFHATSFLTPLSVLLVENADKLKKTFLDLFQNKFNSTSCQCAVIFSAPSFSKTQSFYQFVEEMGEILEFEELKPWEKEKQLVDFVNHFFTSQNKKISPTLSSLMTKWSGLDQVVLSAECEKLLCYCLNKTEITIEDAEQICSFLGTNTVWQFTEALFARDTHTALKIAKQLLSDGMALLPFLRQIRSQFQTGYQISLLLEHGKAGTEITADFPYLRGQLLEKNIKQAQTFGLTSYYRGLILIDQMELKVKNSGADEQILTEVLVYQLTQK